MIIDSVKITAVDYNPLIEEPWDGSPFCAYDGSSLGEVPDWLIKALDNGVVTPHSRNCTDYSEWDVKTKKGMISMSPGDCIRQEDLEINDG